MHPIRTPKSNVVYKLKGGTDANDLPAERVPLEDTDWILPNPPHLPLAAPTPVSGPGRYLRRANGEIHGPNPNRETIRRHLGAELVHAIPTKTALRSTWLLDDDDQAAIARTGLIELTVWGEPTPPVALGVVLPGGEVLHHGGDQDTPISRSHFNAMLGSLYARMTTESYCNPDHDTQALELTPDRFLEIALEALEATSADPQTGNPADPDAAPAGDPQDPRADV